MSPWKTTSEKFQNFCGLGFCIKRLAQEYNNKGLNPKEINLNMKKMKHKVVYEGIIINLNHVRAIQISKYE